jgi:hypothetical protein
MSLPIVLRYRDDVPEPAHGPGFIAPHLGGLDPYTSRRSGSGACSA